MHQIMFAMQVAISQPQPSTGLTWTLTALKGRSPVDSATFPKDGAYAVLDLVSAATKDLFEGDNVTAIENTFKRIRGVQTNERYFKEIVVLSTNLVHVFARLKSMQSMVVVAVGRSDANLGLALMKMRSICGSETV